MSSLYRVSPELNRLGPVVPVWFKKALAKVDKNLVIQFRPPRSENHPRGVNPVQFPRGALEICKRIGKSGLLHPYTVWSLADAQGKPAPPGPDTLRLIKRAYALKRSAGNLEAMERELDKYFIMEKRARASKSKEKLMEAIKGYCSVLMRNERQWNHRVYLRRETPKEGSPTE